MSNVWLISDTHLNHDKIKTYCQRPDDFTERIDRNVHSTVKPGDTLLHLGDVGIGDVSGYMAMVKAWPGYKVLVRGNHDPHSCQWYVDHGFQAACDAMVYRSCWLTHYPYTDPLPKGTNLNLHGHLHNVWDGFLMHDPLQADEFYEAYKSGHLPRTYNRLFSVEYTDYRPVEFNKFVSKPDKYKARGPKKMISIDFETHSTQPLAVPDATGDPYVDFAKTIPGWKTAVFYDKDGKQTWRSDGQPLGSPHPDDLTESNGKL